MSKCEDDIYPEINFGGEKMTKLLTYGSKDNGYFSEQK